MLNKNSNYVIKVVNNISQGNRNNIPSSKQYGTRLDRGQKSNMRDRLSAWLSAVPVLTGLATGGVQYG